MITLAAAEPDAQALGMWLLCAYVVLRGAVDLKRLLSKPPAEHVSAPIPTPVVVKEEPRFADVDGVKALAAQVAAIPEAVHDLATELRREIVEGDRHTSEETEKKIVAMHQRIEKVATTVDRMSGAVDVMSRTMTDFMAAMKGRRT